MFELGASSGLVPMVGLMTISFLSFMAGLMFRKWPDRIQEIAAALDGSLLLLSAEAHRALIRVCGTTLSVLSFGTLLAAALLV